LFREGFLGLGISHVTTSAHNPTSNGLAERGVMQIKDVIKKSKKKPSASELREHVFSINNHEQVQGGSAAQQFVCIGVRSKLPNSIIRELDHHVLIKQRHDRRIRITQEKGLMTQGPI
jgi:hypothetical protein